MQSFGVIAKERTEMEIIEKKERNHFELEDTEMSLRLNEDPKLIRDGEQDPILNRLEKTFNQK